LQNEEFRDSVDIFWSNDPKPGSHAANLGILA
jgi:hypothetical protein